MIRIVGWPGAVAMQYEVRLAGETGEDYATFIVLRVAGLDAPVGEPTDGYLVAMDNHSWAVFRGPEAQPHLEATEVFSAFDLASDEMSYEIALAVAKALGYADLADPRCECCDDYREICRCDWDGRTDRDGETVCRRHAQGVIH